MNRRTKALYDVSVLMDALNREKKLESRSEEALSLATTGTIDGYLCAASVDVLNDLLTRAQGTPAARAALAELCRTLTVIAVDGAIIKQSLALGWAYLEDAVIHECARIHGIDRIVTLNPEDYVGATLPVCLPVQLAREWKMI